MHLHHNCSVEAWIFSSKDIGNSFSWSLYFCNSSRVLIAVWSHFLHVDMLKVSLMTRKFVKTLLATIHKCKEGALLVAGMVCSSWVAISRSSTRRYFFVPLGDPASKSAQDGNVLVSRPVLVMVCLLSERCTCRPISTVQSQDDTRLLLPPTQRGGVLIRTTPQQPDVSTLQISDVCVNSLHACIS